jgi:hypothetical protein
VLDKAHLWPTDAAPHHPSLANRPLAARTPGSIEDPTACRARLTGHTIAKQSITLAAFDRHSMKLNDQLN